MIKSGTTFFSDMYWHNNITAMAVREMGMRAAISHVFIDFFDPDNLKKQIENFEKNYANSSCLYDDNVILTMGPHAINTLSEDGLKYCAKIAKEKDLRINIHLSETEDEVEFCKNKYRMKPVEFLEKIGLLGENVIAAHAIWTDDNEIEILKNHNVNIAHNPSSNMKLASGSFSYTKFEKAGLNICLATDGCSSNNNLDMGEEMKIASLLIKSNDRNPTALSTKTVFEMATTNTAKTFGLKTGKIEVGYDADCILVDLDNTRMVPGYNLISDMVYSADSSCIKTTICQGRVLMLDNKVNNEREIIAAARKSADKIKKIVASI